jgi:hypothetical protein
MAAAALFKLGRTGEIPRRFPGQPLARPLRVMLEHDVHCPPTTSLGRWFDAAAGLLGAREVMAYEGQAAMLLEGLAERGGEVAAWPGATSWTPIGPTRSAAPAGPPGRRARRRPGRRPVPRHPGPGPGRVDGTGRPAGGSHHRRPGRRLLPEPHPFPQPGPPADRTRPHRPGGAPGAAQRRGLEPGPGLGCNVAESLMLRHLTNPASPMRGLHIS